MTILILNGIWIWNDYLLPLLVLGKGNDVMTVPLAVSNFAGAFVKQWDLILTAILMAMIPVIVFFLFAQKYIVKGMVAGADGEWIYFDMVPEEHEVRTGAPEYTGRICVIGAELNEDKLAELFKLK